jgi:hypothetical protein
MVGSGGIQLKSTGGVEIGGTTFKISAQKTNIQSAQGINITSESIVELQSKNNISLRSNRQVYIEPGLGVANNTVVGGSSYTEGEAYVQHITAPVEIQKTEDVRLFAKLLNGLKFKAEIDGLPRDPSGVDNVTITLNADSNSDRVECESHSHHFKNIPLRLCESNDDVRAIAQGEGINVDGYKGSAQCVENEYKVPVTVTDENSTGSRDGIEEANLLPRGLFVPPGTKLPNDRRRVQTDGLIKERFEEVPKEGTKPISSTVLLSEPMEDPIAVPTIPGVQANTQSVPTQSAAIASAPASGGSSGGSSGGGSSY